MVELALLVILGVVYVPTFVPDSVFGSTGAVSLGVDVVFTKSVAVRSVLERSEFVVLFGSLDAVLFCLFTVFPVAADSLASNVVPAVAVPILILILSILVAVDSSWMKLICLIWISGRKSPFLIPIVPFTHAVIAVTVPILVLVVLGSSITLKESSLLIPEMPFTESIVAIAIPELILIVL